MSKPEKVGACRMEAAELNSVWPGAENVFHTSLTSKNFPLYASIADSLHFYEARLMKHLCAPGRQPPITRYTREARLFLDHREVRWENFIYDMNRGSRLLRVKEGDCASPVLVSM